MIRKALIFNPLASQGEGVTVFTSPYLSAGAPALGEAKGLMDACFYEYKYTLISFFLNKNY